jgi:TetR/AcrR family transcriptional regulator, repressor of fatR-cypB operon
MINRMNVHSIKSKPRRGRPLVDDKRRRILDAALRAFAERGYHGTAVPEVAVAADVSTGTLYHYFASKELLVNEVYRDAKQRLRTALLAGLPEIDVYEIATRGEQWFAELWRRLGAFANAEPDAFRFLEMQDHTPYLDADSRALELAVLAPLFLAGQRLRASVSGPPVDVLIALLWGAFVGLVKASRLGYLALDAKRLAQAGDACWRMIAPPSSRTAAPARADAPSRAAPSRAAPSRAATSSRSPRTRKG